MKTFTTLFAALVLAGPAMANPAITNLPPDQQLWDQTPEGVAFAPLEGNRFAEPYMAMVRLPAGTVSPPHVKSANMFGVMIEGRMTHRALGDASAPETLGPGAYYKVPANLPHVSSCISDTPCVTFLVQDGAFDFLPVQQ